MKVATKTIRPDSETVAALRLGLHDIMRAPRAEFNAWDHKRIYKTMLDYIEGRIESPVIS